MIPTVFGIAIALIGILLLVLASVPAMFAFVILCSLMGGSAAFILPAVGGSSIPPVHFALGFLILRMLLPGSGQRAFVWQAFRQNMPLVIFVIYGVAMAYVGPRIFAEQMNVAPMKTVSFYIYATTALRPTSQNITAAVYLVGTMMCAVGAYVACRNQWGAAVLVRAGLAVAALHIFYGITGVIFADTGYEAFLEFVRNGSYAQVDQRIGTVVRMNGIMPEPSAFATYGFAWFVFLFECWFRGVSPRATGPMALAVGFTLVASTSSTAYLGLGGYALIFLFRTVLVPAGIRSGKLIRIGLTLLTTAILVSVVLALNPELVDQGTAILTSMTVGKQGSLSALQRTFWAQQGLYAFQTSLGLGIGPGSFRSSSLSMAIAGATGVVGMVAMAVYVLSVLKPLRASTFNRTFSIADATGVAASWAAISLLIPANFISPTADPGSDFAIFAGAALALRLRPRRTPSINDGRLFQTMRHQTGQPMLPARPMLPVLPALVAPL